MNGEFILKAHMYRSVSTLKFYYNVRILPAQNSSTDDKDERVITKRRETFSTLLV